MNSITTNFLTAETTRNIKHEKVFTRFMHRAVGPCTVLVAHHITYEIDGQEPVEIPSADTLLFSPELMGAVFGEKAPGIMLQLAHRVPAERELVLSDWLDALEIADNIAATPAAKVA